MFGLTDADRQYIIGILQQFKNIESAVIFGSRAKGTMKIGSDIDIALKGTGLEKDIPTLSGLLNDTSPLPYFFDIVDYSTLSAPENANLKDHIDRVGVSLYRR